MRDVALGRSGLRRPEPGRQDAHEQIHVVQIGLQRDKQTCYQAMTLNACCRGIPEIQKKNCQPSVVTGNERISLKIITE